MTGNGRSGSGDADSHGSGSNVMPFTEHPRKLMHLLPFTILEVLLLLSVVSGHEVLY